MALSLKRDQTLAADYVGTIGATVSLQVQSNTGAAEIITGHYDGDILRNNSFKIARGVKALAVILTDDPPGDWAWVLEIGNDKNESQVLRRKFKFEPKWPGFGVTIRGEE